MLRNYITTFNFPTSYLLSNTLLPGPTDIVGDPQGQDFVAVPLSQVINIVFIFKYSHRACIYLQKGKRPLGRPRRRREDNIKMDVQEAGCGG
jgi:hypothetical protein